MTLSSGSTLGFANSETGRIYVWAIDNAGAVELALSRRADTFPESSLVSTTAEGGSGAADSATVMYSTSARSNVACRCLGFIEITTGATAGQWSNAPSKIQLMLPGVKRTGDLVQTVNYSNGQYATGTTPLIMSGQFNSIPQQTNGDQYMSTSITPTSALNKLIVNVVFNGAYSYTIGNVQASAIALFKDSVANALAASALRSINDWSPVAFSYSMIAGTTTR